MSLFIKLIGKIPRLEDLHDLKDTQRFTDRFSKLDYDYYIDKDAEYFCIAILLLENTVYYIIADKESKYLSHYPAELFANNSIIIPESWGAVLHPEIGNWIIHPKLIGHLWWWTSYHEDEPETLALVDEIIDEIIKELQAEEDAKNPKKDPFDDYWGL